MRIGVIDIVGFIIITMFKKDKKSSPHVMWLQIKLSPVCYRVFQIFFFVYQFGNNPVLILGLERQVIEDSSEIIFISLLTFFILFVFVPLIKYNLDQESLNLCSNHIGISIDCYDNDFEVIYRRIFLNVFVSNNRILIRT